MHKHHLQKLKTQQLGFLRKPGVRTFGAGAIAGTVGAGLVKEFRNDDPYNLFIK